jgi:His-Xaa-Ser system radical SAM maturase HxsB
MPLEVQNINKQKAGFFRFKELNGDYLITNQIGEFCFLNHHEFDKFIAGEIEQAYPNRFSELRSKSFIRDQLDINGLVSKYSLKNASLLCGPSLHIVVVTLRCDHKCTYCQTSSQSLKAEGLDMSLETAQKVVDTIFESPSKNITIEFQGGEPLVNWDVVKFTVDYAQKKNKLRKKKLLFSFVSNLTFLDKDKLAFITKNNIAVCTSLDGPESIHNKNRVSIIKNLNSYNNTVKWIKKINTIIKRSKKYRYKINALPTITRQSLPHARIIVDEYVRIGMDGIFLRQVSPFGLTNKNDRVNISGQEFSKFYREALDYIIELNLKGKNFYERTAKIFLTKILLNKDPNFLDIRSPCGAGIGQMAYNFNGKVYTCDEGRMLSATGDELFYLGNISENSYQELINKDVVKSVCLASCLDNIPVCSDCVYNPYCGVCPVYNYVSQGNIFSKGTFNEKCLVNMDILDYLFEKIQNKQIKQIFSGWVKKNKYNITQGGVN